jgi:hypothetical protein
VLVCTMALFATNTYLYWHESMLMVSWVAEQKN